MTTTNTVNVCPHCRRPMPRVFGVGELVVAESAPCSGALALCADCGGVSVFTEELALRTATPQETWVHGPLIRRLRGKLRQVFSDQLADAGPEWEEPA
jgi:hypothetical protein